MSSLWSFTTRVPSWSLLSTPPLCNSSTNLTSRYSRRSLQRFLCSKQSPKLDSKCLGPKAGFVTIYKLPFIGSISKFHKAKQVYFRVLPIAAPVSIALYLGGLTSMDSSLLICVVGLTMAIKVYLLGFLTSNLVGFIYTSPDMSAIQISYVDNQGRRQEDIFPTADLVPLTELPAHPLSSIYQNIEKYSESSHKAVYKLNLSHGKITDMDRFTAIFGKVDL